jgi:hypothetical protein
MVNLALLQVKSRKGLSQWVFSHALVVDERGLALEVPDHSINKHNTFHRHRPGL